MIKSIPTKKMGGGGGGSGEQKSLLNFNLHLSFNNSHHHHHNSGGGCGGSKKHGGTAGTAMKDVPKGCLAIRVGREGEEKQRVVVPVIYFNHPLFLKLLKEAEEEYGFDQKGTITIPCYVEEFRHVQGLIDKEHHHHHTPRSVHHHHQGVHHHHQGGHHHHRPLLAAGCFRA